jgi:hypothetical protein
VPNYADPATLLLTWLAATTPSTARRWLTEPPDDMIADLPIVVANRYSGADDLPGLDIAHIDLDVYATGPDPHAARAAALDRAEDLRRTIRRSLAGAVIAGVAVQRVRTITAPTIRPYDSRGQIRRAHQAVQMWLHRPI